jgi:hypothetical protein
MDGPVILRRLAAVTRSCYAQAAPTRDFSGGGYRRTGARVVVLVVVLACTIAYRMAESCGLEGYRDGAITSQPHHFFF